MFSAAGAAPRAVAAAAAAGDVACATVAAGATAVVADPVGAADSEGFSFWQAVRARERQEGERYER